MEPNVNTQVGDRVTIDGNPVRVKKVQYIAGLTIIQGSHRGGLYTHVIEDHED